MRHTCSRVLAVVTFAGLLAFQATTHAAGPPTQAKYKGLTYGEWIAVWWQTALAIPVDGVSHPIGSGGVFGGKRMVFLSAGVPPAGSPPFTLAVTIRPGTPIFVPIITVECSEAEGPPFHGDGEAQLRACANGLIDLAVDLYAEIDGKPVKNPAGYQVESPLFRYGPLPANNFLGLPPGTQSDAVGTGYFLLLEPLSAGQHRIIVRANVPDFGIAVDSDFIVNVDPNGQ